MNVLDRLVVLSQPLTDADGEPYPFLRLRPEWVWVPTVPRGTWRSAMIARIQSAGAALSIQHIAKRTRRAVMRAIRLNTEEATWFRTVPR